MVRLDSDKDLGHQINLILYWVTNEIVMRHFSHPELLVDQKEVCQEIKQ